MTDEVKGTEGSENQINQTPNQPEIPNEPAQPVLSPAEELKLLKERAKVMGIAFSGNIGLEALKAKINAKMEGETDNTDADGNDVPSVPDAITVADIPNAPARKLTKTEERNALRNEMMKTESALVRLRITNLNPQKKDLPGEIFTVANEIVGTFRKFIPYGEATEDGYHVPMFIYRQLRDRKFLHVRTIKDKRTGIPRVVTSWQREFALEELPTLTKEELQNLANAQAAAGSVDRGDVEG